MTNIPKGVSGPENHEGHPSPEQQERDRLSRISKDVAYAMRYWEKRTDPNTRKTMEEILTTALSKGAFHIAVYISPNPADGISEKDKEKLSAYRLLADEMGYELGPFVLQRDAGNVRSDIRKKRHITSH